MFNPSRWVTGLTTLGATLGLAGCSSDPTSSTTTSTQVPSTLNATTGNGAPSGAHYTLNIIGVPKDKSPDFTGGNGHRIFVDLGKTGALANTRINLTEGDFAVLDANGTDGTAAFQLPNPDPDGDGTTVYSVFARALGTPGGKSLTTTCAIDPFDGSEVCSVITLTLERGKGKSTFE